MRPLSCHLAFTYWNRAQRRYAPLPDGVEVLVREADPLSPDDTLGRGTITGGHGRVDIAVPDRNEDRAEIYFEIRFGDAAIDPASNTIVPRSDADATCLHLPAKWTTRNRYDLHYRRGLWEDFDEACIGLPDEPVTYRVSFDCFVRFVRWDDTEADFVGLPEGTTVRLVEHDVLERKVLATDQLDDKGRSVLTVTEELEHRPDLSLELSIPGPDGRPDARSVPWTSREHLRQGSLSERGYWEDHVGTRIGRWGSPYTFDVGDPQPRRIPGNLARYLIDGPAIFAAIRDGILAAQRSIHVQVMLFYDDRYGSKIRDLLVQRAREGVQVRVMFDVRTTGSSDSLYTIKEIWLRWLLEDVDGPDAETMLATFEADAAAERERGDTTALRAMLDGAPNLQRQDSSFPYVEIAPAWFHDADTDEEPLAYRELRAQLRPFTVARIDHRKLLVFDGERALMGGANFGEEYLFEEPFDPSVPAREDPWIKWHDVFIALEGPIVRTLQSRFRERWVAEGGDAFDLGAFSDPDAPADHPYFPPLPPREGGVPVSLLDTTPGARLDIHAQLLALLAEARREVFIENPYFSSREVLHRLCETARRGVRVVCIFPDDNNDSWDFLYAARLKYPALIEAGVEVYEYGNHMTHAKVAVIDDMALIGSANLNHASLFNHYELLAVVHDADFARRFRAAMFEHDLRYSKRIAADEVQGLLKINDLARAYLRHVVDVWF